MNFERQMEFLLQNQANHDAKIAQLLENHKQHDTEIVKILGMQAKNEQLMGELVESVTSLARIAHLHEQRISGVEDRP